MQFSKILNDPLYLEMSEHILDNVISYDLNNNYFKIKKGDQKTINYVLEAAKQLGHIGGSMNSYGHAKYLLATGKLPLSKDPETGRYMVDTKKPEFEIVNEAFNGEGYVDILQECFIAKNVASDYVIKNINQQYLKGNFETLSSTETYKPLHESYVDIIKNSQIPYHHFNVNYKNNTLKFHDKNYNFAEDLNYKLTEGKLNESEASKYFKQAQDADEKFFDICKSITKQLIKMVENVATKLASDNNDTLKLETLDYEFINQEDIIKEFFDSQYNDNHPLIKNLTKHYEVDNIADLVQKFNS
jgi:hypothetical protein